MEMGGLYNTLRPGQPLGYATDPPSSASYLNYQAARTVVTAYLCPSDASSGNGLLGSRSDGSGGPDPLWAVNDYKACSGANWFGVHQLAEHVSRGPLGHEQTMLFFTATA